MTLPDASGLVRSDRPSRRTWIVTAVLASAALIEIVASGVYPLIIVFEDPMEAVTWFGFVLLMAVYMAAPFAIAGGISFLFAFGLDELLARRGRRSNRFVIAGLFTAVSAGISGLIVSWVLPGFLDPPATMVFLIPPLAAGMWTLVAWSWVRRTSTS